MRPALRIALAATARRHATRVGNNLHVNGLVLGATANLDCRKNLAHGLVDSGRFVAAVCLIYDLLLSVGHHGTDLGNVEREH